MKLLFSLAALATFISSPGFGQISPVPLNQAPARILGHPLSSETVNLVSANPNLVEGRELYDPHGLALDTSVSPPILYVSDTRNNRVLAWKNAASFRNGQTADIVIGQSDFYGTLAGGPPTTSARLSLPSGLAVYNGDLYVADSGNNRYLRFRKPFDHIGNQLPDLFVGQPNANSKNANYNGTTDNQGIFLVNGSTAFDGNMAFDSAGNLWVTDPGNRRVLEFSATDVANGGSGLRAILELGQLNFGPPQAQITAATRTDPKTLANVNNLAIDPDSGRLFVSDAISSLTVNRVLVFSPPFTNGMAASRIMGLFSGTNGTGICQGATSQEACDRTAFLDAEGIVLIPGANGKSVGIVDRFSNRILVFDPFEKWPDQTSVFSPLATSVIGQSDTSKRGVNGGSGAFSSTPGAGTFWLPTTAAFSGSELFVADGANNRIVVLPLANGAFGPASRVLGQDFFTTQAPNLIEGREFQFLTGASTAEAGIVIDFTGDTPHLYVADSGNNRVLGFRDARKAQAGQKADMVIGQADFTTALCNFQGAGNPDSGNPGKPTQSSLCGPTGLLVDSAGNLYVADSLNSRVLRFPSPFASTAPLPQADLVLGQRNFTTVIGDATATTMNYPYGLAFAGNTGLLVSDTAHSRMLMFPFSAGGTFTAGTDNGKAATKVFGQADFTSSVKGGTDSTMNAPRHIATDGEAHIYVADSGNSRVMIFDQINSNPDRGAPAAKILGSLGGVRAVYVNQTTGELWVGDNTTAVKKYPQFSLLLLNPASNGSVFTPINVLAIAQDGYGDLALADLSSRVSFYYPGTQAYNGANFSTGTGFRLAPGAFGSICSPGSACDPNKRVKYYGSVDASNNSVPYPKDLGDVQVLFNGDPAPLTFVSSSQINFVVPMSAPTSGTADIVVVQKSTGRVYGAGAVGMAPYSPGIFQLEYTGARRQAAIINQDGTVNSTTNCAPAGTYVSIYATGQGFVPNAPPDGSIPTGLVAPPVGARVAIGQNFTDTLTLESGEPAKDQLVQTALSPQFPGVWQVNAYIPRQTVAGPQIEVGILVGSYLSNYSAESGFAMTMCVKRP